MHGSLKDRIGLVALFLFAFFAYPGSAIAFVAMAMMALLMFFQRDAVARDLVRSLPFQLMLMFAMYVVVRAVLAVGDTPDLASAHWRAARHWISLAFFLPVGYWIARFPSRLGAVMLAAVAGLIVSALLSLNPETIRTILNGERFGFGFEIVPWGLYSGTALLGLIICLPRIFNHAAKRHRYLVVVAWLLAVLFLAQSLFVTQSRGSWIAFAVALPLAGVMLAWLNRKHTVRPRVLAGILLLCTAAGALIVANQDLIEDRIAREERTVRALLDGNNGINDVPLTSIGMRVHAWALAASHISDAPWFGKGPAATRLVLDSATHRQVAQLAHVHQAYLEVLVAFGALGAVLLTALVISLLIKLRRAYVTGHVPTVYSATLVGSVLLWGIWSLTDFRLLSPDGRFLWALVMGMILGCGLLAPQVHATAVLSDRTS